MDCNFLSDVLFFFYQTWFYIYSLYNIQTTQPKYINIKKLKGKNYNVSQKVKTLETHSFNKDLPYCVIRAAYERLAGRRLSLTALEYFPVSIINKNLLTVNFE